MNDYFFKLVDARCKIVGMTNLIEGYLNAVENDQKVMKEVYYDLLKRDLVEAKEMIEKGIHD